MHAKSAPSTATSRSASSSTITGPLPPSSSDTFFTVPEASRMISRPTAVEPVNATLSTSGCEARRAPTAGPSPVTQLSTPSGTPSSCAISASRRSDSGVFSSVLTTIGVAGRERRPDLPDPEHEREVPRNDRGTDADRLPADAVDRQRRIRRRRDVTLELVRRGLLGEGEEVRGGKAGVEAECLTDRRAVALDLELGDLLELTAEPVGDPLHHGRPVLRRHPRPRAGVERPARRRDGVVGVDGRALRHCADELLGRRMADLVALVGIDVAPVDEHLLVGDAEGGHDVTTAPAYSSLSRRL